MILPLEELGRVIAGLDIPDSARETLTGLLKESEKQVRACEFRLDRAEKHKSALNTLIQGIKTDYEAEQEKVNAATRAKSDFLARMSHEIRTPMNAIIGLSHLALRTELTARQEDYIGKILSSSQSLLGIINDILDFSKIEAGKLSIEAVPFSLDETLDKVANQVSLRAAEKNLELLVSIAPGTPLSLMGDPLRTGQILLNLASNAIKFTQSGEVVIAVSGETSPSSAGEESMVTLRFSVRDTGIGLSLEQKARLFQSFSQGDGSTTRKYGGTGLGLVICQRLAQLMGGDIGVESVEGVGSTFWFTLRCGLAPLPGTVMTEKPVSASLAKLRTLVVDDNAAAREVLCQTLGHFGWQGDSVDCGPAALEKIRTRAPGEEYDLVLMDWKMPGMDGVQTAQAIRSLDLAKMPRILMVSAFGQDELAREGKMVWCDAFLAKPVGLSALHDAVLALYGREITRRQAHDTLSNMRPEGLETVRGGRILLVEDNEINQQIGVEILGQEGFWVTVAADGIEALNHFADPATDFDLVLMDLQMPRMDGFTATRQIRQRGLAVPIVAMTADAVSGIEEECRLAGMDDYITKPIDPRELFLALIRWIKPAVREVYRGIAEDPGSKALLASLHGLPGIDAVEGLARVGGQVGTYRELLLRFSRAHARDLDLVREALGKGDQDLARRLAHTLKGVSGNIGAVGLFRACSDLDGGLKSGQAGLEVLLDAAVLEMAKTLKALSGLGSTDAGAGGLATARPGESANAVDAGLSGRLTVRLRTELLGSEQKAVHTFGELRKCLSGTRSDEILNRMEEAIDGYDFDVALDLLDQLEV